MTRATHSLIGVRAWALDETDLKTLRSLWFHWVPNAALRLLQRQQEQDVTMRLQEQDVTMRLPWVPGRNEATCAGAPSWVTAVESQGGQIVEHLLQPTPPPGVIMCACGFNAFFHYPSLVQYLRDGPMGIIPVTGIVRGWGPSRIHRDGWRSQYAEIMALFNHPHAARPAKKYGVPVVSPEGLPDLLGEFGSRYTGPMPEGPRVSTMGLVRRAEYD